jgi:hypothetical protein
MVMISHNLATVGKADKADVIDQGIIVEEGTHTSLLAQDGIYCRLLHAQDIGTIAEIEKVSARYGEMKRGSGEKVLLHSERVATEIAAVAPLSDQSRKFAILRFCFYHSPGDAKHVTCVYRWHYWRHCCWTMHPYSSPSLLFLGAHVLVLAPTYLTSYVILWFLYSISGAGASRKYRAEYLRGLLSQDISFFETEGNAFGALAALVINGWRRSRELC